LDTVRVRDLEVAATDAVDQLDQEPPDLWRVWTW
jgi:hypothetical protein